MDRSDLDTRADVGLFRRRPERDPAQLARDLYVRAIEERGHQLHEAAARTADGDRLGATNAYYAVGQWHADVFTETCDDAFYKAKLRPPPEPFVDIERAVLVFGDDSDHEYEEALRTLARRLELDPDAVVEADRRRQRFVESEGLRRDISDLLGRIRTLDREEVSLFGSLLLERAGTLKDEARELGEDPRLGPEVRELDRAVEGLRQRAMAEGVSLDPRRS
ncbi:hypothetical protein ER308_08535 [Egibacter rhizosphaerae]|uniref:Uncharacterized protein n=1 Tax=Egibacter rhizosphaerae TaxID=1670831 RepID=A0A411YEA9_9ACTN|nr:hypothetical protein [Egibacter rhizosphaerae]QBI19593.1 hypothetical protein ER308_08535 [Egibacter rhizosphaerae]